MSVPDCAKCNRKILPLLSSNELLVVEWKGKKYHKECFGCHGCGKQFEDLKVLSNDSIHAAGLRADFPPSEPVGMR